MKKLVPGIFAFSIIVLAVSCSKTRPAGFWENFHTGVLIHATHDNGPYGGRSEYYWNANTPHTFTIKELLTFAAKNGWQVCDSTSFPTDTLAKWKHFPFTYTDFADSSMDFSLFQNRVRSEAKLYRFTTGWIAVEPGNARETDKNGYALLSKEGAELAVYHLWGE